MTEAGIADREAPGVGTGLAAGVPKESLRLPAHFAIEPELADQFSGLPGHQRCVEGAGELLLVAHEVPAPGVPERQALYFWKRYDRCWTQAGGPGIDELGGLLERYARTIADHAVALGRATSAERLFPILRHAAPLLRSMRNLLQAVEQALAIDPEDREIRAYRDRAREIERAADLLHTEARVAMDARSAGRAEAQAEALERLVRIMWHLLLLLAFFLPPIAFAGFFPMAFALPAGILVGGGLLWLVARTHARVKR